MNKDNLELYDKCVETIKYSDEELFKLLELLNKISEE